jgi:hypothetical protein
MQPVFISPEGRLMVEDKLPTPSDDVTDCAWDMSQLAKLAEKAAAEASTPKKHQEGK